MVEGGVKNGGVLLFWGDFNKKADAQWVIKVESNPRIP